MTDEDLIKAGDTRTEIRKGSIATGQGEVAVDIEFERTRNANGGIDVVAKVPTINMTAKREV